jgi:hypothetical protein
MERKRIREEANRKRKKDPEEGERMTYETTRQKGKKKEWKSKLIGIMLMVGRRERNKSRGGEKEKRGLIVGQP